MAKRRLTDLYIVGKDLTLDDGEGAITVWMKKLNAVEMEDALRTANSARSVVLSVRNDQDSPTLRALQLEVDEMSRDEKIDFLTSGALGKKQPLIEAELADAEEWKKDDYLEGLRTAWDDGLWEIHANHPDDEEANRVLNGLKKFGEQVEKALAKEQKSIRSTYAKRSEELLDEQVLEAKVGYEADLAWMRDFRSCEVYYATRNSKEDRSRYFESKEEVAELEPAVYAELITTVQEISVSGTEGKSSGATEDSSPSSETPEPPATEEAPSGLKVARA